MYLIPKPHQIAEKEGSFYIGYDTEIVLDTEIRTNEMIYASLIKEAVLKWGGMELRIVKGTPGEKDIFLTLDKTLGEQEYRIEIGEDGITAAGGDGSGILYAAETLCQMIEQCGDVLKCMELKDYPDIKHRGYYLDETRGRVLKLDYLKETVDRLCRYKINEFQLYIEHTYMFRGLSEMWRDETPITAEEIIELDRYCRERHVELIPSLASFGHLYTLLSTKSYGDLCEMENSEKQPFSFWDRMRHHTINVADDRTMPLIEGMLEEYMALFTSDKFNICADETFDLGKGKAKSLADQNGVHRIYIEYVKKLCAFMMSKGKKPMFWGDVICGEPFLVKELPEDIVCLTWGYAPNQSEEESRKMAQTGVKQYVCPGVCGWDQWLNRIRDSYENIIRMCSYAKKYEAVGILNTDWGDCGHINDPRYSIPGSIYGAAFSWNRETIPFEEINRQIAKVEYKDNSEQLVNLLSQISEYSMFQWWDAMRYYEWEELGGEPADLMTLKKTLGGEKGKEANEALNEICRKLKANAVSMDSSARSQLQEYERTIQGIIVWNEIGGLMLKREEKREWTQEEAYRLAEKLETWFMYYKEQWRAISREGDLHHIAEIVFWYADLLRGRKRNKRRI